MQSMKKKYTSLLPNWNLKQKTVFLRADLNVPLSNGTILDDFRLTAVQPTLNLLIQKGAKVIIATHLGRPQGIVDASLSTKILMPWFEKKGYAVTFCTTLDDAARSDAPLILLENLRFFPGEQTHDKKFAATLASLAQFYVNDAFGTLHRADSSLTLVPQSFNAEHRTIGLLVERELNALEKLLHPNHPFLIMLGGGKVSTKLPMIKNLLGIVNTILLCPALVFTFLKAQAYAVGTSLVDNDALASSLNILKEATEKNTEIVFPDDYRIFLNNDRKKLITVSAHDMPPTGMGVSIGPKTVEHFAHFIKNAKTIFFNAAMGFADNKETQQQTYELLRLIAQSSAYKVVGGGDSVLAVKQCKLQDDMNFLSTGGGSTLAYLAHEPLPGLVALYG